MRRASLFRLPRGTRLESIVSQTAIIQFLTKNASKLGAIVQQPLDQVRSLGVGMSGNWSAMA